MGVSALKWQGWLVGLVVLAGLLVFAPLGLYVWASGGGAGGGARAAAAPPPDVRIAECRIDPPSRRVVAVVEGRGEGSYVVTVEFRDSPPPAPGARTARALAALPGLTPDAPSRTEAIGPVWPPLTAPWCGVVGVGRE
ncbi:hypothetical protein [Streptomyces cirratus]|nr:hypothetical protein [Streptomyces cirratus]